MAPCRYLGTCTGCHFIKETYVDQSRLKTDHLAQILSDAEITHPVIQFSSIAENQLRTRFDFTIHNGQYGLYDWEKNIIDIESCQQLSKELQQAFTDFRKIKFPIQKGSVRLRVGADSLQGAWLDFANLDIKNLLAEKKIFHQLKELGFHIEIGQKGKALSFANDFLKLSEPVPKDWFKTKIDKNNYVSLNCLICSFTQPSWHTAFALNDIVNAWINSLTKTSFRIAEFGAGLGQFTLPMLFQGHNVDVFESHAQSVEYLKANAARYDIDHRLTVYCDDFQNKAVPSGKTYDLALVNPPRSGLKNFSQEVISCTQKNCIYISCYPESLASDLKIFVAAGFQIKEIIIVDQFPQTKHFETCVLLQRIDL